MCPHLPPCPDASAPDREAAHTIASHPEQGWSLLCNGVVIFEDTGELLPNGRHDRPAPAHRPSGAGRLGQQDAGSTTGTRAAVAVRQRSAGAARGAARGVPPRRSAPSQAVTASPTAAGCFERACVSPGRMTTLVISSGSGTPNGSRSPLMTSTLVPAPRNSASRDLSGCPGGCSGNASAMTPAAPTCTRGAAGNPRPVRPAALDKRQRGAVPRRLPPQHLDELRPGGVLLRRRSRRASAPDPVGLGDQGGRRAERAGGVADREDIGGVRAYRPRRG